MYITAKEWASEGGGYKDRGRLPFRKLPFHCCAITFTGFEDPVCTADGTVFDIVNVVPYIQKFGKHPVTGQPLKLGDLIRLHFHKASTRAPCRARGWPARARGTRVSCERSAWSQNGDNEYCCPVTGKVFTEHTHIVAVRPSGNVYCWEAVDELNVKPKHWKDLLTDQVGVLPVHGWRLRPLGPHDPCLLPLPAALHAQGHNSHSGPDEPVGQGLGRLRPREERPPRDQWPGPGAQRQLGGGLGRHEAHPRGDRGTDGGEACIRAGEEAGGQGEACAQGLCPVHGERVACAKAALLPPCSAHWRRRSGVRRRGVLAARGRRRPSPACRSCALPPPRPTSPKRRTRGCVLRSGGPWRWYGAPGPRRGIRTSRRATGARRSPGCRCAAEGRGSSCGSCGDVPESVFCDGRRSSWPSSAPMPWWSPASRRAP